MNEALPLLILVRNAVVADLTVAAFLLLRSENRLPRQAGEVQQSLDALDHAGMCKLFSTILDANQMLTEREEWPPLKKMSRLVARDHCRLDRRLVLPLSDQHYLPILLLLAHLRAATPSYAAAITLTSHESSNHLPIPTAFSKLHTNVGKRDGIGAGYAHWNGNLHHSGSSRNGVGVGVSSFQVCMSCVDQPPSGR